MSLPLFLVKRVKHLQPTYFTHVPVQVKAAVPEVARSCCSVRTQLLSITKGTSSYWIFQPTANSFQIWMGLHFHIITFVTATHHIICGAGFFLLFIQATQILRKKNVILTILHTAQNLHKKLPVLSFQWLPVFLLFKCLLNKIFPALSLFYFYITRILTNHLLKRPVSRSPQLPSVNKHGKKKKTNLICQMDVTDPLKCDRENQWEQHQQQSSAALPRSIRQRDGCLCACVPEHCQHPPHSNTWHEAARLFIISNALSLKTKCTRTPDGQCTDHKTHPRTKTSFRTHRIKRQPQLNTVIKRYWQAQVLKERGIRR